MPDIDSVATALAEDFLFPRALATDELDILPVANLEALADAGLYGIFVPAEMGGLGADGPTLSRVVETLASGCLTTTLVWIQHFGLLGSLLGAPAPLRDAWLADACSGKRRGGIAFGGLLPGPPAITASPSDGGWVIEGVAPLVSGWERIHTLHVAARGPDETVVHLAVDATDGSGVSVTPRPLAAVNASSTVRVDFDSVVVGEDRVLGITPYEPMGSGTGLRVNGSLALGVARRCAQLLGPSPLDDELARRRAALDAADGDQMAVARAEASAFAMQAASALAVSVGSQAVSRDQHAQRLVREAMFLLVFGARPPIKQALLASLTSTPAG